MQEQNTAFPKLFSQSWKHSIVQNVLYTKALEVRGLAQPLVEPLSHQTLRPNINFTDFIILMHCLSYVLGIMTDKSCITRQVTCFKK